jgi:hypothetical protein
LLWKRWIWTTLWVGAKVNFAQGKLRSIALNEGAIMIHHQAAFDSDTRCHRCICVYDSQGNLLIQIPLTEKSTIKPPHIIIVISPVSWS